MYQWIRVLSRRTRDEDGASAVEYGLLVAGIAALIVLIVFAFGNVIQNTFKKTCSTVAGKGSAAAGAASCQS